ncbi:hypothetical protein BDP55DRAFT_673060 [Colletotrichum godetiae]|uniref:Uncharacterized protein n=1 Tax=Colletotrichum godetiae TaxID=1209918 RepID=A0AAJ0AFN5_9PEZI|nr:uncharacterized protein BDP55DRAFT_673060 [Colletotrichum godetiae]KAK1672410.1 hypothetical protein BDP55DRAFT_673060 [Colletotrichum godetiae]
MVDRYIPLPSKCDSSSFSPKAHHPLPPTTAPGGHLKQARPGHTFPSRPAYT